MSPMAVVEVFLPAMAIMFIPTEDPIRTMSENMRSIIPGAAEDLEVEVVAVAHVPVLALAQAAAEPAAAKRTPSAQQPGADGRDYNIFLSFCKDIAIVHCPK